MKLCSGSTTDQNDGVAPVPFHRNEELRLCVVVLYMNLSCSIPSTLGDYVEMRGHCTISNTHLYTTILCTVPKLVTYVLLKFSFSEKATKNWSYLPLVLTFAQVEDDSKFLSPSHKN